MSNDDVGAVKDALREVIARFLCESSIGQNGGPGSWEERQHYRLVWAMSNELTMGQWCREHADDLLAALDAKGLTICGPGQVAVPVDQAKALAAMLHDNGYHAESNELCANIAALSAGVGQDEEGTS